MISILLAVAILGYLSVILESPIRINKTITALLTGTICWVVIAIFSHDDQHLVTEKLMEYFGEISSILGYRIKQAILYFNADILMRVELKYKGDIVLNLKSKLEESQLNFSSIMFLKMYYNQEENLTIITYQKIK